MLATLVLHSTGSGLQENSNATAKRKTVVFFIIVDLIIEEKILLVCSLCKPSISLTFTFCIQPAKQKFYFETCGRLHGIKIGISTCAQSHIRQHGPIEIGFQHCRSEERRVGKECRSRWSTEQWKKKREES